MVIKVPFDSNLGIPVLPPEVRERVRKSETVTINIQGGSGYVKNAKKWGVAGLNIDGCRVETTDNLNGGAYAKNGKERHDGAENWRYKREGGAGEFKQPEGRFPANLILDEEAGEMLDQQSGVLTSGKPGIKRGGNNGPAYGAESRKPGTMMGGFGDTGGASRFFYAAKASKKERGAGNVHPTVKPLSLMRYLVRLVTPPGGGIILDPFMGSGTTGIAVLKEGGTFLGCDINESYIEMAKKRIGER